MIIKINEMAYNRKDVIDKCSSYGRQFIEHFKKVCEEGRTADSFKHHCHEMQTWYDTVSNYRFKETKKKISASLLIDWFFENGSYVEDIIPEDFQDIYEQLILDLLTGKSVYDSLSNLL